MTFKVFSGLAQLWPKPPPWRHQRWQFQSFSSARISHFQRNFRHNRTYKTKTTPVSPFYVNKWKRHPTTTTTPRNSRRCFKKRYQLVTVRRRRLVRLNISVTTVRFLRRAEDTSSPVRWHRCFQRRLELGEELRATASSSPNPLRLKSLASVRSNSRSRNVRRWKKEHLKISKRRRLLLLKRKAKETGRY